MRDDHSPFVGLAAFQEVDADRFFGRDREIDHVVGELRSRPLVAIVGPSGAGKSSLVRAGVIPALERSGAGWDVHVVRPGRAPLAALALLDTTSQAFLGPVIERLRAQPGHLRARLCARAAHRQRRILVFVDQLEELYTLGAPPDERVAFLACLAAVAGHVASPLRVIVSMRSDFLDRLAEDRRLDTEVARGLMLLPHMHREGMREALLRPVEASEHRFESPALVERMVGALAATPGALPLLQFTATRLWDLRDPSRRVLTEASYEQLGGVTGALATHADAVLAGMSARDARLARAVFLRLVTPERNRDLATLTELRQLGRTPEDMDRVLARLIDAHLLMIESGAMIAGTAGSAKCDDGVVEIVHESLIDTWPLLGRWLDASEDDAVILARLRSAAMDWERSGHAAGLLWTGEAAREARAWQRRYQGELAPAEKRYLAAVSAAVELSRRVRRLFGGVFATAMAVAAAMSWLAWQ